MASQGLLIRLEAKPGRDAELEALLQSALPLVRCAEETTAWFAVRFERPDFILLDVFPDDGGPEARLMGPITKGVLERAAELELLAKAPVVQKLSVLADKLPEGALAAPGTKALLLTFKARSGQSGGVERFLREARPFMEDEARTTAWFAVRLGEDAYGIFDVFPDGERLTGRVPKELSKKALSLLGGPPDAAMLDVVAEKPGVVPN